jgi:guanylate kinase
VKPDSASVFVLPPSFDILEQRLRGRSQDSETAMARRLDVARREVSRVLDYDYVVINDEVEPAVDRLRAIVLAERARLTRARDRADTIVETFKKA